ncbi:HVA22-like protein f isoform X2 [Arachis stenosperma]|uniref:HVA22-like protein f isoform X2 n=1 Tax=Arachis stenosperma TaxID=217475 RepID=UPI0025ACBC71|nr:HVA22-like protein f isoform X2 [Arachis stenosperma]
MFSWPGAMLLYPLYASMRAIESPSTLDDQQWLTYWVLYSFITLFELSFHKVLSWYVHEYIIMLRMLYLLHNNNNNNNNNFTKCRLPFWPYMKLVICMWLVLPMFNGAAYIYENYVRRYINVTSYGANDYTMKNKKAIQMMSFDARKAVERYIDRHGPQAFEKVISAAEREANKH